jgi:hypothetical protein
MKARKCQSPEGLKRLTRGHPTLGVVKNLDAISAENFLDSRLSKSSATANLSVVREDVMQNIKHIATALEIASKVRCRSAKSPTRIVNKKALVIDKIEGTENFRSAPRKKIPKSAPVNSSFSALRSTGKPLSTHLSNRDSLSPKRAINLHKQGWDGRFIFEKGLESPLRSDNFSIVEKLENKAKKSAFEIAVENFEANRNRERPSQTPKSKKSIFTYDSLVQSRSLTFDEKRHMREKAYRPNTSFNSSISSAEAFFRNGNDNDFESINVFDALPEESAIDSVTEDQFVIRPNSSNIPVNELVERVERVWKCMVNELRLLSIDITRRDIMAVGRVLQSSKSNVHHVAGYVAVLQGYYPSIKSVRELFNDNDSLEATLLFIHNVSNIAVEVLIDSTSAASN